LLRKTKKRKLTMNVCFMDVASSQSEGANHLRARINQILSEISWKFKQTNARDFMTTSASIDQSDETRGAVLGNFSPAKQFERE
jgi:hypothetical protein